MAAYLDFEKNIKQLDEDIVNANIKGDTDAVNILKKNLDKELVKTYKNLSDFQKLQLARHPDRPYALDYVRLILQNSYELHGDRAFRDDPAIVCFAGYIADKKVMLIGEQKGRGTKYKLHRNFGMPHPEGYRKVLRFAKLAEKFQIPVVFLVDTPGAYPGIGAEERGQSEAIAKNLYELSNLKTITISIVIGEGGSGGALALGVADKLAMLKNSVFSVISPEGCAAILWNDPSKSEAATKAMKISADDLLEQRLIDDIIEEGIAHRNKEVAASNIQNYILSKIDELSKYDVNELVALRMQKILKLGSYDEK
ncbi:acetyl-CoA carboxylase carboxyl transferase subunit alpha [Campylobacter canadensis]|uniref:Acetyl-coenzyme A carboxylase carboxyl transferase subunit alpha n=1 Tax=Campylobacter canadensis TaxID=449520 RepID=A0ABS7WTP2_9BACT|nr:acetyl-CoA carboxylase carboxyl transferase subunit alpha [Campylobacter canadensis]MBZ7987294.1 acetyl-CoA carboxylase carboxyl transferase subunit alpha [Campylobacter canadensis]MBZ7994372.1 acetyl-CoA carboxylase carboxyl transferase subunit alpha [Campylobacter canadensis]MBZ7998277.1 acetyl-CoA carboxylase carboxyl transferase subunit alpha [Campylobacter canadensis]MBZ8003926.1 acetyl-CoA carboxylase carboxyl transferase subunit alpha [Campylobacter canadensis]